MRSAVSLSSADEGYSRTFLSASCSTVAAAEMLTLSLPMYLMLYMAVDLDALPAPSVSGTALPAVHKAMVMFQSAMIHTCDPSRIEVGLSTPCRVAWEGSSPDRDTISAYKGSRAPGSQQTSQPEARPTVRARFQLHRPLDIVLIEADIVAVFR